MNNKQIFLWLVLAGIVASLGVRLFIANFTSEAVALKL